MTITAEDLLINWARGEWKIGEDPRPLPPNRCISFERNYRPDPEDWQEVDMDGLLVLPSDTPPPVNWEHHKLVDAFFKHQDWIVRRVLVNEYVERYHKYAGITREERREIMARKFRLTKNTIYMMLCSTKERLMVFARGKV